MEGAMALLNTGGIDFPPIYIAFASTHEFEDFGQVRIGTGDGFEIFFGPSLIGVRSKGHFLVGGLECFFGEGNFFLDVEDFETG
jgi:hypothetical protein